MTVKLVIPGQREPAARYAATVRSAVATPAAPDTGLLANVQVVHAYSLSPAARAVTGAPETIEVQDDDVLEIEMEDGFTLWTSAARYAARAAAVDPAQSAAQGVDFSSIPKASTTERGIKEWSTSALRVLRLKPDDILEALKDPDNWPEAIRSLGKRKLEELGSWAAAKLLMYVIEKQLQPGPGLYRWTAPEQAGPANLQHAQPVSTADLPQGRPLLIFIHGTASHTTGSFGAFADADARLHWQALREQFGEHIYAYEHRTLSDSPVENAIALLEMLPVGAQVCLVTHSRGGLVGDLLCLTAVSDTQISRFTRRKPDLAEADAHDQAQLRRLHGLLTDRKISVGRYARVACPARGTLLASDNIDEFLSVLANLIGLIPGLAASPIFQVIKRVTLEVAKRRLDPRVIPGLEAMVPDSPLVALLNTAAVVPGRLGVIAGDIEGGGWLKRLGVFVSDRFLYEGHDNDLVVNTDSMFFGARRAQVFYVFDQNSRVSHFNYFRNESTRSALLRWLSAREDQPAPPGFSALDLEHPEPVPNLRSIQKRSAVPQPVVFVLPGIMGSQLDRKGARMWLDYVGLALGGLARIRDVDDAQVIPSGLMSDYYGELCQYLSDSHEVVPFAYDWRQSIRQAGALLGEQVKAALARTGQPIRFVAHSMGGLVVRSFIAQNPALWEQLCARAGSRLVMLGTPNLGSHSMVETLLGMATTIRQLALLDVFHSTQEILDIVAAFRGALELLPQEPEGKWDWFAASVWSELRKQNGNLGGVPADACLKDAQQALEALPLQIPGVERVVYVAGAAPSTPCGIEIDEHGRVLLLTTDEGDGKVTYAAGKLPGVATWYADAEHGDLANHRPAFPAIRELLDEGRTAQLPATPPSTARGLRGKVPLLPQPVLYPTESDLAAGLMGTRRRRYRARAAVGFKVSVVHANLRYARHPLMVGHYEGDTISGPEGYLDRRLGGALTQRYDLGLYPGPLGTTAVVIREPNSLQKSLGVPRGAVVVGLGRMGELSPATLANAVRQGALSYVAQLEDRGGGGAAPGGEVGLSVLLIGNNSAASITVQSSVAALLRGVAQANREIQAAKGLTRQIVELEIVELYGDVAIQAAYAAKAAAADIGSELDVRIDVDPLLSEGGGAEMRVVPGAVNDQWRRWIITVAPPPASVTPQSALPAPLAARVRDTLQDPAQVDPAAWNAVLGLAFGDRPMGARPPLELRYVALSERARAEIRSQQGQPDLIDKLVEISIRDTQYQLQTARTLFELLIPNELKDALAQQGRLVFVVDGVTGNYPWELMAVGANPICVDVGLVRQLQTARYRAQIGATTVNAAYVVGDPMTSDEVPALPAAREEAKLVASILGQHFQVTFNPDRPGAMEVLDGLFARPYRVLHLAGHGYFEHNPAAGAKARSGMLLEGGLYLTAAEIAQMRQVPDLVFLNCCHLGQLGDDGRQAPDVAFNRLAASISRELIEMGVRAVVAAGWAVRDDAANFFAKTFYQQMLAGAPFGNALLEARRATWRQFPDCNTSGAYQAYGDPDFRLQEDGADLQAPPSGARARTYVSPRELVDALAHAASPQLVRDLLSAAPPAWTVRGEVLSAAGAACSRLKDFENAIEHYRRALSVELPDGVPLRVVQELANIEARLGEDRGSAELIRTAIGRLETVLTLGETGERLSLLGSAYKRLARVGTERDLRETLRQASAFYRRAAEARLAQGEVDAYPVLNALIIDALLGETKADAGGWIDRARAACREQFSRSRDVWSAFGLADAEMAQHLIAGTLGAAGSADMVAALYRAAVEETQASPAALDSVLDQLDFIHSTLSALDAKATTAMAAVAEVRTALDPSAVSAQATSARLAPPEVKAKARKTGAKKKGKKKPAAPRRKAG